MRIVIKIGTSTITHPTGRLNIRQMEALCKVLSDLKNAGNEVILVSSGAIGMGVGKLRLGKRPADVPTKQAAAAVGQCELMYTYDRLFNAYNHTVAQILLTGVDVEHTERRVNFQNTLSRLLELGALPIINENDSVATDEITSIGDNATLAAIVTCCIKADLLVLLSDIDGLYTANPHTHPEAALIPLVKEITPEILALADGAGSALGTGGMATKPRAARMGTGSGADYHGRSAGKTATAQSGRYVQGREVLNTYFAGVYPFAHPRYAIVVMRENGTSGAADCCPVFRRIVSSLP